MSFDFELTNKPVIAILLGAPFTSQNYERIGVPYLKVNFEVVVLDCNPWLRARYDSLFFIEHDYPKIVTITSAANFKNVIRQLKPAYAIDNINDISSRRFIQKTLQLHGTKYVIPVTGRLPAPSRGQRVNEYLEMVVKQPYGFLLKVIRRVLIYIKESRIYEPDIVLLAGRKSLDSYTASAKNILWVASGDYYIYKNIQDRSAYQNMSLPVQGRYALFIDDCIAIATDYILLGSSRPVESESYFILLRQAFDRLERITGMQVVVAAHPHGKDIKNYTSLFGERQVFFDLTGELCMNSDLVLSHVSTGMGFAALWRKPLIILTSESLDKSWLSACIRTLSNYLDCQLLFMESDDQRYEEVLQQSKDMNEEAYKHFIDDFIRSDEVNEVAPWQAFTNFVKQSSDGV